ncbi:Collagen Alpha-6(Vi) Chain [Manis pentadactyla]|nr:Collagen Alpha-6(Vi) Chain [Manis pentadactyla]
MGVIPRSQAEWAGEREKGRGITWPSCGTPVGFEVGARRDGGSSNKEEPRVGRGRGLLAYPRRLTSQRASPVGCLAGRSAGSLALHWLFGQGRLAEGRDGVEGGGAGFRRRRGVSGSQLGEGVSAHGGVLRSESLAPGAAASPSPWAPRGPFSTILLGVGSPGRAELPLGRRSGAGSPTERCGATHLRSRAQAG